MAGCRLLRWRAHRGTLGDCRPVGDRHLRKFFFDVPEVAHDLIIAGLTSVSISGLMTFLFFFELSDGLSCLHMLRTSFLTKCGCHRVDLGYACSSSLFLKRSLLSQGAVFKAIYRIWNCLDSISDVKLICKVSIRFTLGPFMLIFHGL